MGIIAMVQLSKNNVGFKHDDDDNECDKDKVNNYFEDRHAPDVSDRGWSSWGRDYISSRYNPHIHKINKHNLDDLEGPYMYSADTNSGVSATITIDADTGIMYFPDWGNLSTAGVTGAQLYAVNIATRATVWKKAVADIAVDPDTWVRVSLTFYTNSTGGKCLTFGDQGTPSLGCPFNASTPVDPACGAYYYGLQRDNGELLWRLQVSDQPTAVITSSPNVVGAIAYTGVSSRESVLAEDPAYDCCSFKGSALSLDLNNDGSVRFDIETISDALVTANFSGASVWGSAPPVCTETESVVFGTGNFFSQSQAVADCLDTAGETPYTCLEAGLMPDTVFTTSMYAMDGEILDQSKWYQNAQGVDAWNLACLLNPAGPNCPDPTGPDYDFGAGAVIYGNQCGRKFVAALQKSGVLWSWDLRTGGVVWKTYIGPGATLSDSWGIAFNGVRLFMSIGNEEERAYRTLDGTVRCDGFWAAVDAFDGDIEWIRPVPCSRASTACPNIAIDTSLQHIFSDAVLTYQDRGDAPIFDTDAVPCEGGSKVNPDADPARDIPLYSKCFGAVTVGDDLMWGGSVNGYMYGIDTYDGSIEAALRCPTGSIYGAASLASVKDAPDDDDDDTDEYLAFGCGYSNVSPYLADDKVMVYKVA